MALTVRKIESLRSRGRHADGHGLYLQVMSRTNRSWLFRYERGGRERWMGLGPLHTYTLEEARELARRARQQIREGVDPLEARRASKQAARLEQAKRKTFEQCAEEYYEANEAKWKSDKWRQQFTNTLRDYVHPKIGRLSVADVDTGMVLRCVEPIWKEKTSTADRVRRRIQAVLEWATVRNYREGDNPARWEEHLVHILPSPSAIARTRHHAALPYADMPELMTQLRAVEGTPARALELTVLTATRTGEALGAMWSEIDFESKTWTVPVSRMKASTRDHRVPLSDRAMQILRDMPRLSDHVFAGRGDNAIGGDAMDRVLERMGYKDRTTVHGLRSTFRDWAAETTGYPNHVVEMALAHAIGSKVEASYRRGDLLDKRRRLMADWAAYCEGPTARSASVTPMRRRARA